MICSGQSPLASVFVAKLIWVVVGRAHAIPGETIIWAMSHDDAPSRQDSGGFRDNDAGTFFFPAFHLKPDARS
jgi:hypothetical protein